MAKPVRKPTPAARKSASAGYRRSSCRDSPIARLTLCFSTYDPAPSSLFAVLSARPSIAFKPLRMEDAAACRPPAVRGLFRPPAPTATLKYSYSKLLTHHSSEHPTHQPVANPGNHAFFDASTGFRHQDKVHEFARITIAGAGRALKKSLPGQAGCWHRLQPLNRPLKTQAEGPCHHRKHPWQFVSGPLSAPC